MGGRVSDIAIDPRNPFVFYVALGHGGVFKSGDSGVSFDPIFDKQPVLSIGAIAIAPSDSDVIWVGAGEANDRNSSDWGDGAVRRLARDGGPLLWKLLALARADIAASAYPHGDKIDELERRLRSVLDETPSRMQIPISGRDIMSARGIGPGPEVGRLKERLEELVMDGTLPPDREALLEYLVRHPEL